MSSSSGHSKHRRILPCSTPQMENAYSLSSINISTVDTNSSSGRKRKNQLTESVKEPARRKRLLKKRLVKTKQGEQEEKESKEERKRKRKKTEPRVRRQTDGDWETCDESLRHQSELKNNFLFEDVQSPEQIRDAPHFVRNHLGSPILRPRKWEVNSPKSIIFEEKKKTLPVKDLPFSRVQFDDSDEEEDVLCLGISRKQNNAKTYPDPRKQKAQKNNKGKNEELKDWLVDVAIPTVSTDILWNNFVEKNHEKVAKYLARPSSDKQKCRYDRGKNIYNDNGDSSEGWDNHVKESAEEKYKISSKLRKNMSVVRGDWDKSLCKWVRKYDVYEFTEGDSQSTSKKKTYMQYVDKKRAKKRNVIEMDSNSSSPTCQRHNEQNVKDLKSTLYKEILGKRRSHENEKKIVMADVSDSELRRINEIRKFALRLNTKERTITSNDTSLASISKNTKSSCTPTSWKKANKDDRDEKEIGSKKLKLAATKNKPIIRSIELLDRVQFKRVKQNWRLI